MSATDRGAFADRVALVVGAASGIGRATALALAEQGALVAVADLNEDGARVLAQTIGDARVLAIRADVRDDASVAAMVHAARERFGRIDVAVNAAGVGGNEATVANYDASEWDTLVDVNLTGTFRCLRHELAAMVANAPRGDRGIRGSIVNLASTAGLNGYPRHSAYTASKHGVVGLTKAAGLEYARHGVRVNAVCPGFTATPMVDAITCGNATREARLVSRVPVRRLATPEEIASAILYLAGDGATFVVGHAMAIDGGIDAM